MSQSLDAAITPTLATKIASLDAPGNLTAQQLLDLKPDGWVIPTGAVGDGVTDDTAAFQDYLDTGASLYLADGTYKIDGGLTLTHRGQAFIGQSTGATILDGSGLSAGVNFITIAPDTSGAGRLPFASAVSNNYGTIEQMSIMGPGIASTSDCVYVTPTAVQIWQGEAWTYSNLWIVDFERGLHLISTAKDRIVNCLFKNCGEGIRLTTSEGAVTTATANTFRLDHVHFTDCTTGIAGFGADATIVLGDATTLTTLIDMEGGNFLISGGQLESCDTIINMVGGSASISNATLLQAVGNIPFVLDDRAVIKVSNIEDTYAGGDATTPLINLTDNTCSAFGEPDFSMYAFSNYAVTKHQVQLWDGQKVHLMPFPIRPGENDGGTPAEDTRGHFFYAVDNQSFDQGDDIRGILKTGISTADSNDPYVKVSLVRMNHLTTTMFGTTQELTGIENVCFCQGSTEATQRTVKLTKISLLGVTAGNSHMVTIVDEDGNAAAKNIIVEPNTTDAAGTVVIHGSNLITTDYGSATFITKGVDWYRIY